MAKRLFTSESVTEGHPDKICDQISDAVLDAILEKDPNGRVACETTVSTGLVHIMGEITTSCYVDIPKIARDVIREIGYDRAKYGFDCDTCGVITNIDEQSGDIAMGVDNSFENKESGASELDNGAGDQGMMFGYACTGNIIVGAQGDVGALAIDVGDDAAGVAVKAVLGAVIADGADDLARRAGDVHVAAGRDLAHDVDEAGGAGRLAGNAGTGVLRQDGVEDGVGDLVADFVGMPLGDGFGREKNFGHWGKPPIKYSAETQPWKQKARSRKDCAR